MLKVNDVYYVESFRGKKVGKAVHVQECRPNGKGKFLFKGFDGTNVRTYYSPFVKGRKTGSVQNLLKVVLKNVAGRVN